MKRFIIINILLALVMININGCSGTKNTVPSNVNIKKNQLIYINDTMEIWANDGEGNHHNYTPQDSAEYKVVTNHIGSHLNSVFLGYCNLHRYSEIVSVSPEVVSIIRTKKTFQDKMRHEKLYENSSIQFINPSEVPYPISSGSGGQTHSTIQSEQKTDTKN